jgi:hypothetical protein
LLGVLFIAWGFPPARIRAALISQRRSTIVTLVAIEGVALIIFLIVLALTTNIFASLPTSPTGPLDPMATEWSRIIALPVPDYTVVLFIVMSGLLTVFLGYMNSIIEMSADECYLMLRQIENQRPDRFEFDEDTTFGQLRRHGRILDLLADLDNDKN